MTRRRTHSRDRVHQGGYTLIEVVAAMAVLGAGILGIIAMQGAAVNANRRAHEITTATNLARLWQERLRRDAYQWNHPSVENPASNLNNTWYLRPLLTAMTTNWIIPVQPGGLTSPLESAAFDYWGRDVATSSPDAYYCTHVRLTRLIDDELVRAEVRVWWFRQGGVRPTSYANCAASENLATMGRDKTNVRWVYMTQTIHRHDP